MSRIIFYLAIVLKMKLYLIMMTVVSSTSINQEYRTASMQVNCPYFKYGPDIDVKELVGNWLTVYTQPKAVSCFSVHIRATTDLEREQLLMKYGTFGGRVHWSKCFLEVETKTGRHYFQGDGSQSGVFENIIIIEESRGLYEIQDQTADQWTIFGRRGSELLLMRDCAGEAVAIFVRSPYWPALVDLYAILHRSGIAPLTKERVLCEPLDRSPRNCGTSYPDQQRLHVNSVN